MAMVYKAIFITMIFLVAGKLLYMSRNFFDIKQTHKLVQHRRNKNVAEKTEALFTKIKSHRVYLFSAIINHIVTEMYNETQDFTNRTLTAIVSGWEFKEQSSLHFKCCFKLKNDTSVSVISSKKSHWSFMDRVNLQAKQFKCPINFNVLEISSITILSERKANCPNNNKFYIVPTILQRNPINKTRRQIGVCVKITYGSLDAQRLIEWFEVHKLFGVDKVIVYTYNLNLNARKVLKFYEASGMAELHGFDPPEKGFIKRSADDESIQTWNDQQVVLFDCQERLRYYDYVAVIDTDEYLLPSTKYFKNAWKLYFEKKFRTKNVGGLLFKVRILAYTWGESNKTHPLQIGRFINCTLPMHDRPKGIYMPSRIRQGSVCTHGFHPLKGYTRHFANETEAVIHHFRQCRTEWLNSNSASAKSSDRYLFHMTNKSKCADFRRSYSKVIGKLADYIKENVLENKEEIGV